MLVDELRELTNNSKQYQEEYEEIVRKLREVALGGLNEMEEMGSINSIKKQRINYSKKNCKRLRINSIQSNN